MMGLLIEFPNDKPAFHRGERKRYPYSSGTCTTGLVGGLILRKTERFEKISCFNELHR
jgi:hypothetical protein